MMPTDNNNGGAATTAPTLPTLWLPRALAHLQARPLTLADSDTVLTLRRHILQTMPPLLRAVDPIQGCTPAVEQAWARHHLGEGAHALGVWNGTTLVALACLVLADPAHPQDPGHLLGLPEGEWGRAAHLAACLVSEDYRGLHLQTKLLNWRREVALAQGRTLLMALTACGNTHSRHNLMAAGMGIHWVGEWRPGSWWHGLLQDLDPAAEPIADHHHEWVGVSQVARQAELLASGHVGVAEMTMHHSCRRAEPRLQFVLRHSNPLRQGPASLGANVPMENRP